ncbi:MAG TPA: (d)CMP kinase, partial [Luteolibacter sp.]|nr:(d)CMP kinase [Luteolibacter sp.]
MSRPRIAIAIDGPAASGKSTLARCLAERLGLVMVNSGAMYRAVTWKILQQGIAVDDHAAIVQLLKHLDIRCSSRGCVSTVAIDGRELGEELRSEAVNANVSAVSAIPEVRRKLIELQRAYL